MKFAAVLSVVAAVAALCVHAVAAQAQAAASAGPAGASVRLDGLQTSLLYALVLCFNCYLAFAAWSASSSCIQLCVPS